MGIVFDFQSPRYGPHVSQGYDLGERGDFHTKLFPTLYN
jgi:hypothetical protein